MKSRKKDSSRQMNTSDWTFIHDKCLELGFDPEPYKNVYHWGKLTFDLIKLQIAKELGNSISPPIPEDYL